MMLSEAVWSGWLAGLLIGLVMLGMFWLIGKPLGASRSYCALWACCSSKNYFTAQKKDFNVDRIWFIAGIVLGGALSAFLVHGPELTVTTSMGSYYDAMMPDSHFIRAFILFAGGLLMGIGSRVAGGCTSGNAIVGVSQMKLSSVAAAIMFFVGGLAIVQAMYYLIGGQG